LRSRPGIERETTGGVGDGDTGRGNEAGYETGRISAACCFTGGGGEGVSTRYKFSNTTERGIVCNCTGAGTGTGTGAGGSTLLPSHAAMKSPENVIKDTIKHSAREARNEIRNEFLWDKNGSHNRWEDSKPHKDQRNSARVGKEKLAEKMVS